MIELKCLVGFGTDHKFPTLISPKSYGTFIVTLTSVVKIVQVTNTILRQKLHQWHLINTKSLQEVKQQVLQETKPSTFLSTPEFQMSYFRSYFTR